ARPDFEGRLFVHRSPDEDPASSLWSVVSVIAEKHRHRRLGAHDPLAGCLPSRELRPHGEYGRPGRRFRISGREERQALSKALRIAITGATSGIGAVLGKALAADKHTVFVCARRADRLMKMTGQNVGMLGHACDVTDEAQV